MNNFFIEIAAIASPVNHTLPDIDSIYDSFLEQGKIPHLLLNKGDELFDSMYKTKPEGIILYHVLILIMYKPETYIS